MAAPRGEVVETMKDHDRSGRILARSVRVVNDIAETVIQGVQVATVVVREAEGGGNVSVQIGLGIPGRALQFRQPVVVIA